MRRRAHLVFSICILGFLKYFNYFFLMLTPTAEYNSGLEKVRFEPGPGPHTTNGKTSGPSDYVLNAGQVDKDIPAEATDAPLGQLRAKMTTLQDKINIFLTERMKNSSDKDVDMEKLIGEDEE